MAYFLKKSNSNNDIYLQIYESFYDPDRKASRHRSVRPLGYVKKLKAQGIEDPVSYYKDEVDRMNTERKEKKEEKKKLISKESPEKFLGYFPMKSVYMRGLHFR